jgi:hypothetical protein
MTFIEPEYMQKGMNKLIETWGSQMTEEQLNTMIERMEKRMTTGKQLSNGIISGLIISVIISLIIGLVVKKEKYPDGENA